MSSGIPAVSELIEQVKRKWTSESVTIRPGVSVAALQEFELCYHIQLPADLREYFLAMDGMNHWDMCDDCFSFLPLDGVKAVSEEIATFGGVPDYREIVWTLPDSRDWYVIVDFLISSAVYAIRMKSGADGNPVILINDGTTVRTVAPSFRGFLHAYLTDQLSLY